MNIVVLGSGVVGVTTTYFLAREGHAVTVIDRQGEAASETSYGNAGLVAPGHAYAWASPKAPGILLKSLWRGDQALRLKLKADPRMWAWLWLFLRQCTAQRARLNTIRKLRLCLHSVEALHEVVADTGVDYDGRRDGNLFLYRSQAAFECGVANTGILRENGLEMEVVDRDKVAELEPVLEPVKDRLAGGVFSPVDESGDCRMFTRNLAAYCRERLGVRFAFDTTVRRIDTRRDAVERVVTDGENFSADLYVMALGCDSALVGRSIGLRLPIYPVKGYSVTVPVGEHNAAPRMGGVDEEYLVAWARMGDRLRLTATAEISGYDRSYRPDDYRTMFRSARELFPDAADYDRPDYWAGLRPMTPEGTPILGKARYRNLYLNTGHGHIGWTMSCGSAKVITDLIAGREPAISLDGMLYS